MPGRFGALAIAALALRGIGPGGVADSAISGVIPIAESAIPPGGVRRYSWAGNRLNEIDARFPRRVTRRDRGARAGGPAFRRQGPGRIRHRRRQEKPLERGYAA